jgi:hypothetical protein
LASSQREKSGHWEKRRRRGLNSQNPGEREEE